MPELSVTETQRERLEAVRCDVEEAYVDTYGHTRLEDAVQYLLDTYTPPEDRETVEAYDLIATAEYPQLQRVASDVPGVPGSGIEADEMRGRLLSELGPVDLAAELDRATGDDDRATGDDDRGGGTDEDAGTAATDEADAGAPTAGEEASSTGAGGEDGAGDVAPPTTPNRLLREHDEKWHESDGETPYEVVLPDGTTESARTKDDVRRLLFRHYS